MKVNIIASKNNYFERNSIDFSIGQKQQPYIINNVHECNSMEKKNILFTYKYDLNVRTAFKNFRIVRFSLFILSWYLYPVHSLRMFPATHNYRESHVIDEKHSSDENKHNIHNRFVKMKIYLRNSLSTLYTM